MRPQISLSLVCPVISDLHTVQVRPSNVRSRPGLAHRSPTLDYINPGDASHSGHAPEVKPPQSSEWQNYNLEFMKLTL